jgi:DNA-binding winged helix-turn-helix (wHTH) protein
MGKIQLGGCEVDLDDLACWREGARIPLTRLEARVLFHLMRHAGHNVSKADLLRQVWAYGPRVETRAVEATIHRLRQKLERDPSQPQFLVTTYGVGYRLEVEAADPEEPAPVGLNDIVAKTRTKLAASRRVELLGLPGSGKTRVARLVGSMSNDRGVERLDADDRSAAELERELARIEPKGKHLLIVERPGADPRIEALLASWLAAGQERQVLSVSDRVRPAPGARSVALPPLSGADSRLLARKTGLDLADDALDAVITPAAGLPLGVIAAVDAVHAGIARPTARDLLRFRGLQERFARMWLHLEPSARALLRSALAPDSEHAAAGALLEAAMAMVELGHARVRTIATGDAPVTVHPLLQAFLTERWESGA